MLYDSQLTLQAAHAILHVHDSHSHIPNTWYSFTQYTYHKQVPSMHTQQ